MYSVCENPYEGRIFQNVPGSPSKAFSFPLKVRVFKTYVFIRSERKLGIKNVVINNTEEPKLFSRILTRYK